MLCHPKFLHGLSKWPTRGRSGSSYVSPSMLTLDSAPSKTQSPYYCTFLPIDGKMVASQPVGMQSMLTQRRMLYIKGARHFPYWGPATCASPVYERWTFASPALWLGRSTRILPQSKNDLFQRAFLSKPPAWLASMVNRMCTMLVLLYFHDDDDDGGKV
jgi:hypothetical protein